MPPPSLLPLLPLLLLILATGCAERGSGTALRTVDMQIGSQQYKLEVADTEAARRRGLMERDSMPANHGMLFVFKDERELNFWMKNTRFPLEILYLDAGGQIVSIHEMKPYDTRTNHTSARPAKYAIELNVGQVARAGVKAGDVLEIPASAREAGD
jgi:uncharacterized protein